ncbi:MAG TPA: Gfo/Idh/MocA family oxidoreductase [Gemmatimonadaceae bacterium]|nr:Gfo/Idh/MocA family oxidoreductase [Gemmatimonadaceae bacterium]
MPLHVALIGYGLGGATFHAPYIAAHPDLVLDAIVTADPDRRERARREHPSAALLDRVEQIVERRDAFDLVVVASPNATHVPLAMVLLDAGLSVVVDKPLARTADGARMLYERARARGVMLTPFQNRRWDGDFLTVRRLLAEARLGEVFRFESRFERWRATPKPRWCTPDAVANAEGIIYDIGAHLVDQAIALFGPVREMHATSSRVHPDVRVPDDAAIALTHAAGVRSHLVMSATAGQSGPRMSVYGARGAYIKYGLDVQEDAARAGGKPTDAHWGEEPEAMWGTLGVGAEITRVRTERGTYLGFYDAVASCLARGGPPPVAPDEAIAVIEILENASR